MEASSNILEEKVRRLEQERDAALADQARVEEELRQAHQKLQATLDSITDGLLVLDREWRCTYFSATGARMIGMRREDLIGGCIWDLFPHARDRKFYECYQQAVATGQKVDFEEFYPEPLNKWLECHCYPTGEGLTVYFRDITARKRAEEALQSKEATLNLAVEATGLGIFDYYPLTGELIWSDTAKLHFGLPSEAHVDYGVFLSGLHPEDRARVDALVENAFRPESGGRYGTEYRTIGIIDGQERWLSAHGKVLFNEQHEPVRLTGATVDITERKRVEEALRQATAEAQNRAREAEKKEQIVTAMMEHIPMGITIADAPDVHIRAVSRYGRELAGKPRQQIEGIPVNLHAQQWRIFRSDGVTPATNEELPLTRATQQGELVREEEFVLGRDDGVKVPILCTAAPIRDAQGNITGGVIGWQDITERKKMEEFLRKSEERYRALFESIDEGFCVFEMLFDANDEPFDYRFLETNPAFEQHTGLIDAVGKTMRELVPGIERKWIEIYGRIALTGQPERLQEYSERLDRWFDVYAFRIGDPKERHVALLFTDFSERKRAEEEAHAARAAAEEATRAKSEFLANMSHEIRTPMTIFMAAIEHLLQIDRSPERRHLLGMAEQSAQRLRSLIDDILDLSRIEARKVVIEEKPFDLRDTVSAAVDLFILPAREKNLRLETDIDPDTPEMVAGDPEKIGQVLINLIGNAVKFTHQGEVRVCVQPRDEFLEFAVADTGIGIREEKHHLLFQNFSQVDSSFTRQFGGTGLGLAISKGLVELMGGEISVQSRATEGSAFTFTIPLRRAEKPSAAPAEASLVDSGKENAAARILLAEDEPMIREMITMMLAQRGLHPDTAESGRQAVEKWQDGNFDLVLMDLQMPDMGGMEATRAIRERETEGIKRTCIIGLTAHASREIKEQCLDSGMDQVLTKPVKVKDLLSAMDTCL